MFLPSSIRLATTSATAGVSDAHDPMKVIVRVPFEISYEPDAPVSASIALIVSFSTLRKLSISS